MTRLRPVAEWAVRPSQPALAFQSLAFLVERAFTTGSERVGEQWSLWQQKRQKKNQEH